MKRIEKYFSTAVDAIEILLQKRYLEFPSEYNGYAADFGVSLRAMGVIPAVLVYHESLNHENVKEFDQIAHKGLFSKVILLTIQRAENNPVRQCDTLIEYVITNKDDILLKLKVMDAAIAVKLAMRLFIKEKEETNE